MDAHKELARLAERFELPGKIIRLFDQLHDADPAIARRLVEDLAAISGSGNGQVETTPRPSGGTNFDRLAAVFLRSGNAPLTKAEMLVEADLKESSLHALLYDTAKDAIEAVQNPKGGRGKAYRLRRALYQELSQKGGG